MLTRIFCCVAMVALVGLSACDSPKKTQGPAEKPPTLETSNIEKTAAGPSQQASSDPTTASTAKPPATSEVVFNPLKPPAGYKNCHHNHCHLVGGGVASYTQVMKEMGATKVIEPPKPPAPSDVASPPADAKRTASGLAYKLLEAGSSDQKPGPKSTIVAHLSSWTTDGTSLQSTSSRGKPASISLERRIFPGLLEAFQLMAVGSEYRFWMPPALAYNGRKGMVVFDIQLLQVRDTPATP